MTEPSRAPETVLSLDSWLAVKTGLGDRLSPLTLKEYQLAQLRKILHYAKTRSFFYRRQLKNIEPDSILSDKQLGELPFTTGDDLRREATGLVCLPQKEIARIMSLNTSGTKGRPKRVFFSERDQNLCVDFFTHGMRLMAAPEDLVGIFLGPQNPGNTADLLIKGLRAAGIKGLALPWPAAPHSPAETDVSDCGCLVGPPVMIYQLAKATPGLRPKSVLLCADYIPPPVVASIKTIWNCRIFSHYGSTESGLGGAVSCHCECGLHPRHADIFFEIIDPATCLPVADGDYGEVVFTTLTRNAMPLIRYRTGDISRILPETCDCGSPFPRLDAIKGRFDNSITLPSGDVISIHKLDDLLLSQPEILDYSAELTAEFQLRLTIRLDAAADFNDFKSSIPHTTWPPLDLKIETTTNPVSNFGEKRVIKRFQ